MAREGQFFAERYQLLKLIGERDAGEVYWAQDTSLHRPVAVKILSSELANDGNFLRRFRAETQAAARLSHPNIVSYYDWGLEDGVPYVVSDLCRGGSLRDMLESGARLSPSQALEVGIGVADGLQEAHSSNLIHSGIAPSNILFDSQGRVKITDFALAALHAEASLPSFHDRIFGPSFYAAPEEVESQEITEKVDVYALAVVLVEAVTGEHPFASETALSMLWDRLSRPLPCPPLLAELAKPLAKAGTIRPEDRSSLEELAAELRNLKETLPPADALPLAVLQEPPSADFAEQRVKTEGGDKSRKTARKIKKRAKERGSRSGSGEEIKNEGDADGESEGSQEESDTYGIQLRRRKWTAVGAVAIVVLAGVIALLVVNRDSATTRSVPNVVGMDWEDALKRIGEEVSGDWVEVKRYEQRQDDTLNGEIIAQDPEPGEQVAKGATLTLTMSLGDSLVTLPEDIIGIPIESATLQLQDLGLELGETKEVFSNDAPAGIVLGVDDERQKLLDVPPGSSVYLTVSAGAQLLTVPPGLVGSDINIIEENLREAGFDVSVERQYDNQFAEDKVLRVAPESGTVVSSGDSLLLVVSDGPRPVPELAGLSVGQARVLLQQQGFCVAERTVEGDVLSEIGDDTEVRNSVPPAGATFSLAEEDEGGGAEVQCVQLILSG